MKEGCFFHLLIQMQNHNPFPIMKEPRGINRWKTSNVTVHSWNTLWSAINNHTDTVCPPLSWALERWHRILLPRRFPMPLRNNIERVKTTTTTSILEVLKTLMGEVRQCRLRLNYAEPWPSMAIGSHWRFFWGREVTWWKLFVYHSYITYNHI